MPMHNMKRPASAMKRRTTKSGKPEATDHAKTDTAASSATSIPEKSAVLEATDPPETEPAARSAPKQRQAAEPICCRLTPEKMPAALCSPRALLEVPTDDPDVDGKERVACMTCKK